MVEEIHLTEVAKPQRPKSSLQLLEELAGRARNVNPARDAPLAVLNPFHNARSLAALRAIRALGSVHDLLAVCCLCNLSHGCHWFAAPDKKISRRPRPRDV